MSKADGIVAGVIRMSGDAVQSSRVLVVRSGVLRDRVAAAIEAARLDAEVEVSPSYLSAMGWLTRERVDVIVGPVSAMTGMVGSTARALRRLAPGTRLIVVAEEHERAEAGAAVSAGFDDCIYEPADASALLATLRLIDTKASDQSVPLEQVAEVTPEDPSRPDEQPANPETDPPSPASLGPDLLAMNSGEAADIELVGQVGDVDLAEAVMRGDGTLVPLATRLLQEQSGIDDVHYAPTDAQADASADATGPAQGVAVAFAGRLYGRLISESSDDATLGPWAAWLARWVALESRQHELSKLAMRDELTGLWNRRYFDRFLNRLLRQAGSERQQVTLLIFDIDNFKQYNDNFGHPAGDEILKSTASLIQSLVREHDVVARIGGDEFAVVFWDKGEPRQPGSQHPDNVIGIAKRFQKAICEHRFPKLAEEAVGRLTVSGGLAGFPWDGRTPEELFEHADAMAIRSKRQGKNAICFGPGAAPNGNGGA